MIPTLTSSGERRFYEPQQALKRAGGFSYSPRPEPRPLRRGNSTTEYCSMSSFSVHRSLPPTRRCSSDDQDCTRYPTSHKPHEELGSREEIANLKSSV